MVRKKLIQKLQQLIDKLPVSDKRKEAKSDLLKLKLSKTDCHYIMLADKYKELMNTDKNDRR
jgi:predicted nucleic acid-binding protein